MVDPPAVSPAILARPFDDAPRLVYARALHERGDPRGAFIEAQCALARCHADEHDRREALTARVEALLATHGDAWLAPLGLRREEAVWSRGFVDLVRLSPARLGELSARLVAGAPVRALHITGVASADELAHALEDPLCLRVTSLDLRRAYGSSGVAIGTAGAHVLREATHLTNLRELHLRFARIGREGAKALAAASHLAGLEVLDLHGCSVGPEGTRALARAQHFANLRELSLGDWEFANEGYPDDLVASRGAHELAAATHMTKLRSLSLPWSAIDAHGAHALADAPHLAALRTLDVAGNMIKRAGARALTRRLTELRDLDIRKTYLGYDGLREALAPLRHVTSLDVGDNKLHNEASGAVRALTEATHLATLRELWLFASDVDDAGLRALLRAPHLTKLTKLGLADNPITAEGLRSLAEAPCASTLTLLGLESTTLGLEGARALADATSLRRIAQLRADWSDFGDEGLRLLREAPHLRRCAIAPSRVVTAP